MNSFSRTKARQRESIRLPGGGTGSQIKSQRIGNTFKGPGIRTGAWGTTVAIIRREYTRLLLPNHVRAVHNNRGESNRTCLNERPNAAKVGRSKRGKRRIQGERSRVASRRDPLGLRNGRGECFLGLLPGKYSRCMGVGSGVCTAEVEDKQAEGEEEEAEAGCGQKHL